MGMQWACMFWLVGRGRDRLSARTSLSAATPGTPPREDLHRCRCQPERRLLHKRSPPPCKPTPPPFIGGCGMNRGAAYFRRDGHVAPPMRAQKWARKSQGTQRAHMQAPGTPCSAGGTRPPSNQNCAGSATHPHARTYSKRRLRAGTTTTRATHRGKRGRTGD